MAVDAVDVDPLCVKDGLENLRDALSRLKSVDFRIEIYSVIEISNLSSNAVDAAMRFAANRLAKDHKTARQELVLSTYRCTSFR